MSLTVQQVIDEGYGKSAAARTETSASAELVLRVGTALRDIFLDLSREHPEVIGAIATPAFNNTGWARPADCLRALVVKATANTAASPPIPAGTEIQVVPFNDQSFARGNPALTEFGQQFIPTGQTVDPSGGTLSLFYARAPIQPSQASDTIDPLFPDFFLDYLALDMAEFLAIKDKRSEDAAGFVQEKMAIQASIMTWAEGQTQSVAQRFPMVTPPATNVARGRQTTG